MPRPISLPELIADLSADATTISFDTSGGLYDRFHAFVEEQGILPETKKSRTLMVAAALLASRLVKQQLGPLSPLTSFFSQITDDGLREQAKRILEAAQSTTTNRKDSSTVAHQDAIWELDETARTRLLQQFERMSPTDQQRMRDQMIRSTTSQLALLAGMPPKELTTLLAILKPETQKRVGLIDQFAIAAFPWLKEKERK